MHETEWEYGCENRRLCYDYSIGRTHSLENKLTYITLYDKHAWDDVDTGINLNPSVAPKVKIPILYKLRDLEIGDSFILKPSGIVPKIYAVQDRMLFFYHEKLTDNSMRHNDRICLNFNSRDFDTHAFPGSTHVYKYTPNNEQRILVAPFIA